MAEFRRVFKMQGFDVTDSAASQMVPLMGVRYVALRDGQGMTVDSADPSKCAVREVPQASLPRTGERSRSLKREDRIFQIAGNSPGETLLVAAGGAGTRFGVVNLKVRVTAQKIVRVAFYFVRDSAGHRTVRHRASVRHWIKRVNEIFNDQANVYVTPHTVQPFPVPADLGTPLEIHKGKPGAEAELAKYRDADETLRDFHADVNVYMIWKVKLTVGWQRDAAVTKGTDVLLGNSADDVGTVLAHELGHALGVLDEYRDRRRLMYYKEGNGIHLSRADIYNIHLPADVRYRLDNWVNTR